MAFAPAILNWFEGIIAREYHFSFPPPVGTPIPIDWQTMKQLIMARHASAFSVHQVRHPEA